MLERKSTVEDAFVAVVRSGLGQMRDNANGTISSPDPEFIHQMRVGMRRFRSAFVAFRAAIPTAASAGVWRAMHAASQALGAARDWDVLWLQIEATRGAPSLDRASLAALQSHIQAHRAAALRRVRGVVAADSFTAALQRADRWIEKRAWRRDVSPRVLEAPVKPFARRSLKRLLRKSLASDANPAVLEGDDRHRLRVRIRRLRYVCEFFNSLYRHRRAKAFISRQRSLQDTLGELNDIAVAGRLLGVASSLPRGARLAVSRLLDRLARRERRLLSDLEGQWNALKSAKPFW